MEFDWNVLFDYLATLNIVWLPLALQIFGTVVVVASAVDKMIEKVDFMSKLLSIPVLGSFLTFVKKFSILAPKP